jgi:TPR repeat protein
MRTSNILLSVALVGVAFGFSPAASFDGVRSPDGTTVAVPLPSPDGRGMGGTTMDRATPLAAVPVAPMGVNPRPSPFEAFRSGTQALRAGNTQLAVTELQYAAEQGIPAAQWKLGRMYADGEGVDKNNSRAFEYFRRIVNSHADDVPGTPQAPFVANAFVALGRYYLEGIPDAVKADPSRAREMFRYAASYFGDSDAQYNLGRLYLLGQGAPKDPMQAARWLRLASNKGHHNAQAMLGAMLFKGEDVSRQAALGLFWLTVAKDGAGPDEGWIADTYASAFAQASDDERELAYRYLENWLRNRRE